MSCKVGFMVSLLVSLIEKFLLLFLFPYFCLSVSLQGQSINFHKQMHHFVLYSFLQSRILNKLYKLDVFGMIEIFCSVSVSFKTHRKWKSKKEDLFLETIKTRQSNRCFIPLGMIGCTFLSTLLQKKV